jgi:succinyl-CoA synthetase alpha subunit
MRKIFGVVATALAACGSEAAEDLGDNPFLQDLSDEGKEDSATEKIARLEAAGIPVVERIDEIPDRVKEAISR